MTDDEKSSVSDVDETKSKDSVKSEDAEERDCPRPLKDCVEWNSYNDYDALGDGLDSSIHFDDDNDITTFELDSDCESDSDSDSDSDSNSDSEQEGDGTNLSNEKHLANLHCDFRIKIFQASQQITQFDNSKYILKSELDHPFELPSGETWDFRLGNIVRVTDSQRKLKSLQSQILGWNSKLKKICGKIGVVHACLSPQSNAVSVYFPSEKSRCVLYAGVIEKVSEQKENEIKETSPKSQWELGDLVFIRCDQDEDEDVPWKVKSAQQDLGGKQGKIVAILSECILVTYNGKMSWSYNPDMLIRYPAKAQISVRDDQSSKYAEGEEVCVVSSLKRFIQQQKDSVGWQSAMTSILGKKVKVLGVLKDETVVVQGEHTRPWRVHSSSLLKNGEEKYGPAYDKIFEPGDYIQLKVDDTIYKVAKKMAVPAVFLEFPNLVGRVYRVDDDFDNYVQIGKTTSYTFAKRAVKVPEPNQKKLKEIEYQMRNLKAGDLIQLNVGTPKFVKQVLADADAEEHVVHALTQPGKLIGFIDNKTAVVEYEGGKKYKINKKYLTVPELYQLNLI